MSLVLSVTIVVVAAYVASVITTIAHEFGHALAGLAMGSRAAHIMCGTRIPPDLPNPPVLSLSFKLPHIWPCTGGCIIAGRKRMSPAAQVVIALGGPLSGLVLSALATLAIVATASQGSGYVKAALITFAVVAFTDGFVIQMLPRIVGERDWSDGKVIADVIRGGSGQPSLAKSQQAREK